VAHLLPRTCCRARVVVVVVVVVCGSHAEGESASRVSFANAIAPAGSSVRTSSCVVRSPNILILAASVPGHSSQCSTIRQRTSGLQQHQQVDARLNDIKPVVSCTETPTFRQQTHLKQTRPHYTWFYSTINVYVQPHLLPAFCVARALFQVRSILRRARLLREHMSR
jgi:hypothetical protein